MINRVTENMKYNTLTGTLFNVQGQAANLMEKISTQKNINRPSDDPIGASKVLNYTSTLAAIEQYQANVTSTQTWLSTTDTTLEGIKNLVAEAQSIAVGATDDTMASNEAVVDSLINDVLSLINSKSGDSYIFGGSNTDVAPFSATYSSTSISPASAATNNTFDGTVTSGGTYTGTENKTYVLKIISGTLTSASYQTSSDGGKTWGTVETADLTAGVTLGDNVIMTFAAGTTDIESNDLFTVNAYTAGYYRGNDDNLTVQVGKGSDYAYNITGSEAFTATNGPVASASVVGTGTGLTVDDTITLTRGSSVGSWSLTANAAYPDMQITSMSATGVSIDADGDGTEDINLSLSGNWYADNTASFSITAGTAGPPATSPVVSAVDVSGTGTVDLLTTLNALKTALQNKDLTAVNALSDDLGIAQTQVLQAQTKAGAKASSLTNTSANLTSLNEQITSLKSEIDDADLSKLIVSYQLVQTAMEASYNMAAKIGQMTILDYL